MTTQDKHTSTSAATTPIQITVFDDTFVTGMAPGDARASAQSLDDAMGKQWPTDAHFTAYEPRHDASDGSVLRLIMHANEAGYQSVFDSWDRLDVPSVRMVVLVGDIDGPGHVATPEWRAETVAKIEASGLAHYQTKGGYRLLASIDYEITTRAHGDEWTEIYLGWCEHLRQAYGLELDPKCADWTRLYRLPNVKRGKTNVSAEVVGKLPAFDYEKHWLPPTTAAKPTRASSPGNATEATIARAQALAERLPPSVVHHGGDDALFKAANEIATVIGKDTDAIATVLRETFNPRCQPPWDESRIKRAASRAAEWYEPRIIGPMALAREAAAVAAMGPPANDRDGAEDGLVWGSLSDNPPRQNFLVPELEIGVGRPYGWLGKTNASKTLALMQIEVHLALGLPVFGQFAGPSTPIPVLRIAYEGFHKAPEDYLRLLRGTGQPIDFAELNERLRFAEGRRHFDLAGQSREWLMRVTAPFGGGLCVIDPLIAAARGLEENSTEIAQPIYDLEGVSKANGVTFILAHHFGHAAERARGHSSIEGAFGASAAIAKIDGNGQKNNREVHCQKMNRYGFERFNLEIKDTTQKGKAWTPTVDAIRARETSWAVSVTTGLRPARADVKAEKHSAAIAGHVSALEALVKDSVGGVGATQAKNAISVNGTVWNEVLAAAKAAGRIRQRPSYGAETSRAVILEPAPTAEPIQRKKFGKFGG